MLISSSEGICMLYTLNYQYKCKITCNYGYLYVTNPTIPIKMTTATASVLFKSDIPHSLGNR